MGDCCELPYFVHQEVKEVLQEDLASCEEYGKCFFSKLLSWLSRTPEVTSVRINTLNMSIEKAKYLLQEYLNLEYPDTFIVNRHPKIDDVLIIPSAKFDEEIRKDFPEIIVDVYCGVAVLRGSNIYAPGVLAMPNSVKEGNTVSVFCDIEGKCRRGLTKPFDGMKVLLGNGKSIITRRDIFTIEKPKGIAIKMTQLRTFCPSLGSTLGNIVFLQNIPSLICSHVLNPLPGEFILDMCAAPGGKTAHIAMLMKNCGKVIALDKTQNKLNKIKMASSRFGLSCIETYVLNSVKAVNKVIPPILNKSNGPFAPPYAPMSFDRILLDAPCSALGQRPQLCFNISLSQLKSYPSLQKKLFATAVELLKIGGILVYSTCTFTLAENENIVAWALETFPCLQLSKQEPYIGSCGLPVSNLTIDQLNMLQRFDFRSTEAESIGFFIAKFIKA